MGKYLDTARENYAVARDEILQRMNLRDRVLLLYVGAVGVLFSVALAKDGEAALLVIVPFLGLGAQCLITQHSLALYKIVAYCRYELKPFLDRAARNDPEEPLGAPPMWDASNASKSIDSENLWLRTLGESMIIVLPSVVALVFTQPDLYQTPLPSAVWWLAVGATLGSFLIAAFRRKLGFGVLAGRVKREES